MSIERTARGALALALLTASCAGPSGSETVPEESESAAPGHATTKAVKVEAPAVLSQLRTQFGVGRPELRLPAHLGAANARTSPLGSADALSLERVRDRFMPRYDTADTPLDDLEVSLPASAADAFDVRRTDTQLSVRARLVGAQPVSGEASDGFVVYEGAGPNSGTLLQKVTADGTEDYLTLDGPVAGDEVIYEVELSDEVSGLRLVANTLEFLAQDGAPALRVPPPYLVTAEGEHVSASLDVTGCEVDRSSAPPWGRPTTAPGDDSCLVHVSWKGEEISYPALLDPAWTTTTSMQQRRSFHTATRLSNGRVLVAGGWDLSNYSVHTSAELYDPVTQTWSVTGSMPNRHLYASAELLADGRVLVAGGYDETYQETAKAELYNPSTGTWTAAASMSAARGEPFLTRLPSGSVLVAGGSNNGASALTTTAIYDPANNAWTASGSMTQSLAGPVGVRLGDRILLVGGSGSGAVAELYNIDTGIFSSVAAPTGNYAAETITKLSNGLVLIAGGSQNPSNPQVYNPTTNTWTRTGATSYVRGSATATPLNDGRVLIVGSSQSAAAKTSELYDPTWGTWVPAPDLSVGRMGGHTATLLANGKVLIAGGGSGVLQRSVELLNPATTATAVTEYRLPASLDADVLADRMTEIWASVHRPAALAANVRYPVVVFLHGNHETCGTGSNPRDDSNIQYTLDGTCPQEPKPFVVVPNHRGYDYVANELAARGYIVVSINANRGITMGAGMVGDDHLILARGRLVLRHLELLSRWNRGVEATPASLGASLQGKLDLSQLGLMGHSRGGEGMRAAYQLYRDAGSAWPSRIVDPVYVRGIFEVAPVDGYSPRVLNADNTRWAVLLPTCDGDLGYHDGVRAFDRMVGSYGESVPSFKASYMVWGANHNFFNTEWQKVDPWGCKNHRSMFGSFPNFMKVGSAEQRQTGFYSMLAFFLANVGSSRDLRFNSVFDTRFAPVANVRIDRGYTPASSSVFVKRLEDFTGATGTNTFGVPNVHSNVSVEHVWPLNHHTRGALVRWTSASTNTYFQSNWSQPGSGMSFSPDGFLDFRVDRENSALNPFERTTFVVQLVNGNGALSTSVPVEQYADLVGPAANADLVYHSTLQTARIPLSAFGNATLSAIRGVRFTFSGTSSGSIYLANIQWSHRAIDSANEGLHSGIPAPVVNTMTPPAAPAVVARGIPESSGSALVTSGNSVLALREKRDTGVVEIELQSTTPFSGHDEFLVLQIGNVKSTLSGYTTGDMTRIVFKFPKATLAALKGGEPMSVRYGTGARGPQWSFGALDKTRIVVQP